MEEVWIEAAVLACSQTLYFPFRDRRVQNLLTASTRGWGWGKEKIDTLARFPIVNNNNNNKGRKRLWTGYCIAIVQGPRCTGNTFQMIYWKERLNHEKSVRFCLNLFGYCAATICVRLWLSMVRMETDWNFQVKLLCCLGFPFDRIIWYLSFQ